jgi:U3 small nucleolar RNA-associated protein 7
MGHVALMDWREKELITEINLREKIRCGTFLHSQEMFALAQKQHLFVYDKQGTEIHKLPESHGLEYLPYHFLLASLGTNKLSYYDTSTGFVVAEHTSRQPYTAIRQNPSNGIIGLSTAKGTVEWWTPGMGRPAVQIFVGSSVVDMGFHKEYMVTASNVIKIWDTRRLDQAVFTYPTKRVVSGVEISAMGLLAVNYGFELEMWKDVFGVKQTHPYMKHPATGKNINNMRFVPFEDVLGLGLHQGTIPLTPGFSSLIIPGSGDPNYDTF